MRRSQFLRGAAALAASCWLGQSAQAAVRTLSFVHWSDVHWGSDQDAPAAWREALHRGLDDKPEMAVFTGDHGDNGRGQGDFIERARAFWGPTLPRMGNLPMVLTLGNADFRANYQTDPANLAETESLYRDLLGSGYYLDALGNGHKQAMGLDWISLNTQIFSPKNRFPGSLEQARLSLDWLKGRLTTRPAVLLLHIPPSIDLYTGQPAWSRGPLQSFWSLVQAHRGPLTILGGHFHRNEVHAFRRSQGDVFTLIAGSLSRKYDYAPNWRSQLWTMSMDGQLEQVDYQLHYPGYPDFARPYRVDRAGSFLAQVDRQAYLNDVFAHHPQIKDRWKELTDQFWIEAGPDHP
ncbi:hypothetical protein IV102_24370 [bacterium]|nr:hypothetical protein [bacterium]